MQMEQNVFLFTGTREEANALCALFGQNDGYKTARPLKDLFASQALRVIPLDFNPTREETKATLEENGYSVGDTATVGFSERGAYQWYGVSVSKLTL